MCILAEMTSCLELLIAVSVTKIVLTGYIFRSLGWLELLIAAGVIGFIVLLFKGKHRSGFVGVLSVLFALGVLFFYGWSYSVPPKIEVAYVEENGVIKLSEEAKAAHPMAADPSLEALWDKLTKSRINLEEDALPKPVDDAKDEAVKEAVSETFGLDKDGKLPPDWVITPPKQVGPVYRVSVASDPFVTEEECRRQLEQEQLPQSVARRINQVVSGRGGHAVNLEDPLPLGIGLDFIFREICRDQFTATADSSVGEMKKVHVLLEFNPNVDEHLAQSWLRWERQQRLASFGKIAALSLTGLAAVYGLLRFDTWSKGYYSRQLLVGSVLAIIALAVFILRT